MASPSRAAYALAEIPSALIAFRWLAQYIERSVITVSVLMETKVCEIQTRNVRTDFMGRLPKNGSGAALAFHPFLGSTSLKVMPSHTSLIAKVC